MKGLIMKRLKLNAMNMERRSRYNIVQTVVYWNSGLQADASNKFMFEVYSLQISVKNQYCRQTLTEAVSQMDVQHGLNTEQKGMINSVSLRYNKLFKNVFVLSRVDAFRNS